MYRKPSKSRRHVVIDITAVINDHNAPEGTRSSLDHRVACICLLVDDGAEIKEISIIDVDERAVLLHFWGLIQINDVFIGHNVDDFALSLIRQRSWVHRLIPSSEIELCRFYSHAVVDVMDLCCRWDGDTKSGTDGLAQALSLRQKASNGTVLADLCVGNLEAILRHVRENVRMMFAAFLRLSSQPLPDRWCGAELPSSEGATTSR